MLLENSDFMKDICLYCLYSHSDWQHEKSKQNNFDWVQRGSCTRRTIMDYSNNFECFLCRACLEIRVREIKSTILFYRFFIYCSTHNAFYDTVYSRTVEHFPYDL